MGTWPEILSVLFIGSGCIILAIMVVIEFFYLLVTGKPLDLFDDDGVALIVLLPFAFMCLIMIAPFWLLSKTIRGVSILTVYVYRRSLKRP